MKPNLIPYIIGGIAYLLMLVGVIAAIIHYWQQGKIDNCIGLAVSFFLGSLGLIMFYKAFDTSDL